MKEDTPAFIFIVLLVLFGIIAVFIIMPDETNIYETYTLEEKQICFNQETKELISSREKIINNSINKTISENKDK